MRKTCFMVLLGFLSGFSLILICAGCNNNNLQKNTACLIPYVKASEITVDGSFDDWKSVPCSVRVQSIDAGIGEQAEIPEGTWSLDFIKLAWDTENIYCAFSVKDSFILWDELNWWEKDGFELFVSGNTTHANDMHTLKNDEMSDLTDAILQFYMAGQLSGFWKERTEDSAVERENEVEKVFTQTEDGYSGEFKIPLSIVPSLKLLLYQEKPVKLSFRIRDFNPLTGISFSASNVAIPVERNKLCPARMETVVFDIPGRMKPLDLSFFSGKSEKSNLERVTGFTAVSWKNEVSLSWRNPSNNFKKVKIVKNKSAYPANPSDGKTIYEGTGQRFSDKDFTGGKTCFYSIYAYDYARKNTEAAFVSITPGK